jgi:hypothetical protein
LLLGSALVFFDLMSRAASTALTVRSVTMRAVAVPCTTF